MTVPEILSNEELRRHEFPVVTEKAFFAHAGVCPLPRRVAEAMRAYATRCSGGDQESTLAGEFLVHTRALGARLLNAAPDEVALVGPTSLALSYIASGLTFRKHSNILVYLDDYPSNVYPWMALAEKGVQVRFVNTRELGRLRPLDVLGQVDEQTRLVALASCHYVAGFRLDINAIGAALRKRNILFCLDAIQTLGAFPTTVENVDFLAADSHKWMLGPCAAGLLYVRKELQEHLRPPVHGWNNLRSPNFIAQEELVYQPGARRYEAGTHNWIGLVGMAAAMELLLELGIDNIAAELARKRAWLVPALQAKGYTVLHSAVPPANAGGITTFHKPDADMPALHARLTAANIATSLRMDRAGQQYLRLSPHVYNTDAELQRALDLV